MTPARVAIFIVAAVIAAFGTAYYAGALDDYLGPVRPEVARLDAGQAVEVPKTSKQDTQRPSAEPDRKASSDKTQGQAPKPETAASGAGTESGLSGEQVGRQDRKTPAADNSQEAGASAGDSSTAKSDAGRTNETVSHETAGDGAGKDADRQNLASLEPGKTTADRGSEAQAGKDGSAGSEPKPPSDSSAAGIVDPAFDLVRVEPDGSMVVAGHAAPDSTVELISGSTVLGSTKSGPQGDFAIVLDTPLGPGNYQIVLRSTTKDNIVAASRETAVVSVPDDPDGDVLALVEQPGKPSRLITVPKGKEKPQVASSKGADTGAAGGASTDAAGGVSSGPSKVAALGDASGSPKASASTGEKDSGSRAAAEAKIAAGDTSGAERETDPRASGEADSAGRVAGSPSAGGEGTTAAEGNSPRDDERQARAAPSSEDGKDSGAAASPSGKTVFIQAVEIDGGEVFAAGGATPGYRVRVYANDILLGEAEVSPTGRFLVEAKRDLPVGDYIVRADLLSKNGAEVIARAAVPFHREPGEKLAAVAPAGHPANGAADGKDVKTGAGVHSAVTGSGKLDRDAAGSGSTGLASDGKASVSPAQERPNASESDGSPKMASRNASGDDTGDATREGAERTGQDAAEVATAASSSKPGAEDESQAGAIASGDRSDTNRAAPIRRNDTPAKAPGTGGKSAAAADTAGADADAIPLADGAPVVSEPGLETAEGGAVIIRRGDTLWHISRRVYGHGTRYTTIYLANQKQIRDPDMIWPGQVFSVPDKSAKGETADMKAIGDQIAPETMAGTEPAWRK